MSKRFTNKLNMTDRDLAKDALGLAVCDFQEQGSTLYITSGEFRGVSIELQTGDVSGDEDFHSEATFERLRQWYCEAQVRREYAKTGTTVDDKQVDEEGNVVLMWHMVA